MFHRDYVLRLVEQLGKALGALVALKRAGRFDEAELTIAQAARNLVGMDVNNLLALSVDQLVALLSPGGSLDGGKCLVVSELLFEQGEVSDLREEEEAAYRCRARALGLLLEFSAREGLARAPEPERYRRKLGELAEALSGYPVVAELQKRLILHLEREGDFSGAEDVLFELLDAGHLELVPAGIELYERLLTRTDDELESGGLPRVEVVDGLAELKARRGREA